MKVSARDRCNRVSALLRKLQLLARRDEAILSGRPAAEVERREILLEGLIDMGSRALHDRLEPAEPHPDQFPNTGLSIRPFVDHCEPLRLVRAQRQNDPSSGFDLIEDRRRQSLGGGRQQGRTLIEMPFVAGAREPTTNLVSELLAKFARPLAHRFVADDDAAGGQQLLDHTQPKREPKIQPDGVADNLGVKETELRWRWV